MAADGRVAACRFCGYSSYLMTTRLKPIAMRSRQFNYIVSVAAVGIQGVDLSEIQSKEHDWNRHYLYEVDELIPTVIKTS